MCQYVNHPCLKTVIIKKYNKHSDCWNNLIKRNGNILSVSEIIHYYQGFEGDLEYFSRFENGDSLNVKLKTTPESLLLFLIPPGYDLSNYKGNQIKKNGYEYGICNGEQAIYSSIFNEILFGTQLELLNYRELLNDSLLFPSQEIVEKYVKQHHELLLQNKDVEDDEDMDIYEVWSPILKQVTKLDLN